MAAQDELNQLERVFLRLGHAETDEQLQDIISKFLPPVLLKLSSVQEGVRKKVMELLVHLNKRIKSRPKIQLPVETLLVQYQDPAAASFVTNFTIIYIKMGYPRLEVSKQCELAPTLLTAMEGKPQPQQDRFVLNEPPSRPAPSSPQGGSGAGAASAQGLPQPPPGMSVYAVKRVIGEAQWSPEQLEQCKLGIVKFIEAEQVPEVETVIHLVVASSDTRHSVATAADLELKSKQSIIDWNNPLIINKMYKVYLGDIPVKTKGATVKQELKHEPVSTRVKMKILPHLLRSRLAAEYFPSNIQVVYDGLFGANTNNKLLSLTLQFVHHICMVCPDTNKPLGLMLLNGLTKLINEHKEDPKLLCVAYSAVGKLSSRMPQLFTKDIALVQQFFESMCKEEADVRLAIQEALSMMVGAYVNLQGALLNLMEALVAAYITKPEVQVRQVAMKFASTVFAPDHVASRYLLLLAAGDPDLLANQAAQRVKTPAKYIVGASTLPFNPATFGEIVLYLRMCLAYSAGVTSTSQSLMDMQDDAPLIGRYVQSLLSSEASSSSATKGGEASPVHVYMNLLQQLLSAVGGIPVMYCLLEVVSVCPEKLTPNFVDKIDWIKGLMNTNKEDMRELAAQLYAVVVSTMSGNELRTAVQNLIKTTKDTHSPETQHGAILALGYMVGRYMNKRRSLMPTEPTPKENDELISVATKTIGLFLDSESPLLTVAAVTALGEIGRNSVLLIPADGNGFTKLSLVDNLLARIPSGKETGKMKERAIQTLGFLPVGDGEFPHQKKILQGLMDSVEAKQVELQFTVGEALTNAAIGSCSGAARDVWTCTEDQYCPPDNVKNNDIVPWVLSSVLSKYIPSPNPHVRQAACIWLLSLVKKLSHHKEIQSHLKEIQTAFISVLSDPDELSQDVASKGLGLVYELGGEQDQQELVSTLVETLMTGKRAKHAVSEDTEVFQGEALGKSPDGQGLSTYKELCALASDLNQPDLVYKFMNLANHHAMWNSRKGAAFGFNIIAAKAGEQLAPFLPQLVPRLYRYQFDPNLAIRQAMTSIWDALVTDKTMVEKYFKEILQDVISNLTSNMWRVRESSCLALNDLIRGRQADEIIDRLSEIWETLFRVLDDIKESVRKAADLTLKTLSKVCVRMCESTGAAAQRTVAVLLPTLLDKGIVSNVTEVRTLSIQTLVKISKTAGNRLKPHAPRLIPALLEALSVLEPQVLNYLSLRATEQEKSAMDAARLSAAKSSPMMETINMCLQHLDVSVLGELVPKLCDLLKSGIGLGTKGGCASVIVSLTVQCPQDLTPYSGKLMSSLLNGINDRSSVVQKSFAFAIGHLVRVFFLSFSEALYKSSCCLAVHAISHYSPDVLKAHAGVALPLAFLGMHQEPEEEKGESAEANLWSEVWQEHVPGSFGGIRLYMTELIAITQRALQSQSWKMKAQGASAMATIAKQQTGSLVAPHLGMVLSALLQGLAGRTWAGKEELLKAVGSVVSKCSVELQKPAAGQPTVSEVLDLVLKECKKESLVYKMAALHSAADILESTQEDRFQEITDIVLPLIKKAWPKTIQTQNQFQNEVCSIMCDRLKLSTWRVQLGVLRALKVFYQRYKNKSYSSVRTEALAVVELLLKRIEESDQWECLLERSRQQLQRSLATMETDSRPDLKDKAQTMRRKIQALP
ncbi:hypothetical protein cypCar_00002853 [Cyprinus carpio]|nr:hypothetical protein cypCar_00002853 [Cyprinus carpio]